MLPPVTSGFSDNIRLKMSKNERREDILKVVFFPVQPRFRVLVVFFSANFARTFLCFFLCLHFLCITEFHLDEIKLDL